MAYLEAFPLFSCFAPSFLGAGTGAVGSSVGLPCQRGAIFFEFHASQSLVSSATLSGDWKRDLSFPPNHFSHRKAAIHFGSWFRNHANRLTSNPLFRMAR